jgi:hypothetical protein
VERCEPGLVFWPPDKTCYQLYTQGRTILALSAPEIELRRNKLS